MHSVGRSEGSNDTVGFSEGIEDDVGSLDGIYDGFNDGSKDTDDVGFMLGITLGTNEGSFVGLYVGKLDSEGDKLGTTDASLEGFMVTDK